MPLGVAISNSDIWGHAPQGVQRHSLRITGAGCRSLHGCARRCLQPHRAEREGVGAEAAARDGERDGAVRGAQAGHSCGGHVDDQWRAAVGEGQRHCASHTRVSLPVRPLAMVVWRSTEALVLQRQARHCGRRTANEPSCEPKVNISSKSIKPLRGIEQVNVHMSALCKPKHKLKASSLPQDACCAPAARMQDQLGSGLSHASLQ